jgi:hypothetical protein
MLAARHMGNLIYEDTLFKNLFDRMGPTYDLVNLVSSVGFSALWRRTCARNAGVTSGAAVGDTMAGYGGPLSMTKRLTSSGIRFGRREFRRTRAQVPAPAGHPQASSAA